MTASQDALQLLERLTTPVATGAALLELFRFCTNHRGAGWGWTALDDDQISGYALDRIVSRARGPLREAFLKDGVIENVADLIGVGSSLRAIGGAGRISPENSAELVRGLRAVDDALRGFHAARAVGASDSMHAATLRAKLAAGEPLAVIDGFALYPRPLRPKNFERGQGDFGALLDHVAVLKRESDFDVRLVPRLQSGLADQTQFNRVGVVPVVHDHTELSWRTLGTNRYHVEENAAFSSVISDRLNRAMSEICGTNTQLVLMPELVSGPSLRHAVSTHLGERFGRGEGTPVVTLCGTSLERDGDTTRNQATILDAEGDVVWTQNKLHAYEFLATDQSALGLPLGTDPRDRREAIDITPSSLTIVDLSASLRVVVLICEDLIQRPPHTLAVEQMGVTTLLSPIMDKTRDLIPGTNVPDFGWLKDGALAYVRHPGASTFVANSGTLVREHRDLHWSYALAFTVPRHVNTWQPVLSAYAAESPVGWVLNVT